MYNMVARLLALEEAILKFCSLEKAKRLPMDIQEYKLNEA